MELLKTLQKEVEVGLAALAWQREPESLYAPARYMMGLGGKRLRPVLCLLGCELFGGDRAKAMPAALAMEVFHNFTLVHDDLMDEAPLRRGKPTVHTSWDAPTAILAGDVMLVLAYDLLLQCPAALLPKIISVFNETAKRVCEGQQLDMDFQKRLNVSEAEYLDMISRKTAALLGGGLEIGALLGQAPVEEADKLYQFGMLLGGSFQIQDDLLDCYGVGERFGKTIGGDILANKKTYLTTHAFVQAGADDRKALSSLFGMENGTASKDKISRVLEIYDRTETRKAAERKRDVLYLEAMALLNSLHVAEERKQHLRTLSKMLLEREV